MADTDAERIGWYMRPEDHWHEIVDEVRVEGKRRLLSACYRWNSLEWVTRDDRELLDQPDHGRTAPHCDAATAGPGGEWQVWRTPAEGPAQQLYLKTAGVWHIAYPPSVSVTSERNAVYMTACGIWTTDRRISKSTQTGGPPGGKRCEKCALGGQEHPVG